MSLQDDIKALYKEHPNISSKEIIEHLGIQKPTKAFWKTLNHVQVGLRGIYPARRRNTHAHRKVLPKGRVYFIPPKKES